MIEQLNKNLTDSLLRNHENLSCTLHWEDNTFSGTGLYLGKLLICSFCYNGLRASGAVGEDYIVTSPIPGIKSTLGKFGTTAECEAKCIQVAKHFIGMITNTETSK